VKIKREQSDIRKLVDIQRSLIDHAGSLVKPGGTLVYSTCTIEPDENFSIIRWFLELHPEFDIDASMRSTVPTLMSVDGYVETLPSKHGMDGSFAIRLKKSS
jgi:16S rRNA (cytosine967-C5)-methyltransferase